MNEQLTRIISYTAMPIASAYGIISQTNIRENFPGSEVTSNLLTSVPASILFIAVNIPAYYEKLPVSQKNKKRIQFLANIVAISLITGVNYSQEASISPNPNFGLEFMIGIFGVCIGGAFANQLIKDFPDLEK